jgi:hypothetical protein
VDCCRRQVRAWWSWLNVTLPLENSAVCLPVNSGLWTLDSAIWLPSQPHNMALELILGSQTP